MKHVFSYGSESRASPKARRWILVPEHDHARELDVSAARCEIVDAKALKMVSQKHFQSESFLRL